MLNSPTALPYISNPSVVHRSPIMFAEMLANNALPLIPVGLWNKKPSELLCGRHRYISHSNLVGTDINHTDEGGDSQPTTGHTHTALPQSGAAIPRSPALSNLHVLFGLFWQTKSSYIVQAGLERCSPASASRALGLQAGATTLGLNFSPNPFASYYTPGF